MSPLLQLLETIESNKYVETYHYFPDIVLSGGAFLDKEEIDHLIQEGYLETTIQDSFGQLLQLSKTAKEILQRQHQYTAHNLQ